MKGMITIMYELDNPNLLEQCARIKEKIETISQIPERQKDYYAKLYHHWKLSPPAQLWEIEEFEKKAGVSLPMEYVYYLTKVGRGGAGPGTGLTDFSIPKNIDPSLNQVSEQLSCELTEEEWNELFEFHGVPEDGTLCLCAMDLTYEAYLILTGPMHGRVVYLDYDGECAPMWPKGSPDFLTWCENFYSELLAGYDIAPTWKFMWQEPGDENALIRAFQSAEDREYKREVLYSFCKFKKLSKTAKKFLENLLNSEFQDEVTKVLQDFHL